MGGSSGIEDVTGCQTAAAALGKPRKWQHADSWSHLPTGCSVHDNGDMFFNSHPSGGSRPDLSLVCLQADGLRISKRADIKALEITSTQGESMYVIGTVNTNSCPKGSSGIEDVTGCQTAAAALGKPWEWQHADSWSHCLRVAVYMTMGTCFSTVTQVEVLVQTSPRSANRCTSYTNNKDTGERVIVNGHHETKIFQ